MPEWNVHLTDFQTEFYESTARYPCMAAAWGTGKTYTAILKALRLSQIYPDNQGIIVRKNSTDLQKSTMADFKKYTRNRFRINAQTKICNIPIPGYPSSTIIFSHIDELSGITQNINLGWFFIEQGEELDNDEAFELVQSRLRRVCTPIKEIQEQLVQIGALEKTVDNFEDLSAHELIVAESAIVSKLNLPLRQGFVIANTKGHNWIWRKWKNKGGMGCIIDMPFNVEEENTNILYDYGKYASLTEAKTEDNRKNIVSDFYASMMAKQETAPSQYRRCVMNSWEEADTDDACIPYTSILEAVDRDVREYGDDRVVLSADPAEHGNDKFMIYILKGYKVIDELERTKKELMESVGHIVLKYGEHHPDVIVIDDVGVGAGPRSRLRELVTEGVINSQIMPINYGRAPMDKEHFAKLRDEIIMFSAQLFREGRVSIPDDQELIEELAAFSYEPNSKGQITVHRKKEVKEKIGRSPDKADTLFMGLWAAKRGRKLELVPAGVSEEEPEWDVLRLGLD